MKILPAGEPKRDPARALFLSCVFLFLLLASLYSIVTPIFEASDELFHFPYVLHVARTSSLPVQEAGRRSLWAQEGSQPPLYYLLSALLVAPLNTDDFADVYRLNPHSAIGVPLSHGNKNMVIHTEQESFPWRGTVLAVHLVRFFSVLLGVGTVVLTGLLARRIGMGVKETVLALSLVAFNPMFLFITGSVNNDNLAAFLGAVTILLLMKAFQEGFAPSRALIIGFFLGLAALTKLSLLTLLPMAFLGLLWEVKQRKRPLGQGLRPLALMSLPPVFIAGWWYLRNWILYKDFTGLSAMLTIAGERPSPVRWWDFFLRRRIPGAEVLVLGSLWRVQRPG
mgnify:CR=1 FL=1